MPESATRTTTLPGGGQVRIRDAHAVDEPLLCGLFASLGAETRRLRFFSPAVATGTVAHWAVQDDPQIISLVVEQDGELVAHGEAVCDPARDEAEVAFAVADDRHGLGLGTLLLRTLAARVSTRGVRVLRADVLADNRQMLDVLRHAAPVRVRRVPGYLEVRVEVGDVLGAPAYKSATIRANLPEAAPPGRS